MLKGKSDWIVAIGFSLASIYIVYLKLYAVFKNLILSQILSKLFYADIKTIKHIKLFEDFSIIPVRKFLCILILLQKLLCYTIFLYFIHHNTHRLLQLDLYLENGKLLLYLVNGFTSFYLIQNLVEVHHFYSFIVPLFCVSSNLYLIIDAQFWYAVILPSIILGGLFMFCCGFFVNIINDQFELETPFMDKFVLHTERIGAVDLACTIIDMFNSQQWSLPMVGPACLTILFTHLVVSSFHYCEQYFLRSIAYCYAREDCAICMENINISQEEHGAYSPKDQIQIAKKRNLTLLDCYHVFHADCLDKWKKQQKNTCPLCRQSIIF